LVLNRVSFAFSEEVDRIWMDMKANGASWKVSIKVVPLFFWAQEDGK